MKSLLALTIAIGLALPAAAVEKRGGTEADYKAIEDIANRWFAAYGRGDAEAVTSIYDVNARIMSEGDPSRTGNAGLKERLAKSFQTTSTVFASDIEEIEVGGRLAYIVGIYAAKSTPKAGGEAKVYGGRYFILLHRTNAGWKVWRDIDNFTPDADALVAAVKAGARP
jgi:ketosteroid isomerase-like protein